MKTLLQINDLRVRFYTEAGVVNAVNGISYKLEPGETLGVVGESGCGKSVHALSILRLIQVPPGKIETGEIWFNGVDLLKLTEGEMRKIRGAEIAMVFQDPMTSLNPVFTVGHQINEALTLHQGMTYKDARKKSEDLLTLVGIPAAKQRLGDFPHQFSGGMRQRVMLAMAISCNPKLLIADEPTTALDVTIQAQIVDLVKDLQNELGITIIWISHDLGVIAELATYVNVMYAGYIVERGSVNDVLKHPKHPYTIGLLGSLPRLNEAPGTTLISIPGIPPDLLKIPQGCPFAIRCNRQLDQCYAKIPSLTSTENDMHTVACWNWDHID